MPRKKGDGEGTLKQVVSNGKKVWLARWTSYTAEGVRRQPKKVIGTLAEYPTRRDARSRMNEVILEAEGRAAPMPDKATFAEVWSRYVTMKTPLWSTVNRKTVTSLFRHAVLPVLGDRVMEALTPEPLQACLNHMATAAIGKDGKQKGYSSSAMLKARKYISAVFEFAIDERLFAGANPARDIQAPKSPHRGCDRFYSLDEVRRLLAAAGTRERLILELLILGGLRPGEVFALRADDVAAGRLRIDEAVKDSERNGPLRIGVTKTESSDAEVAISEDLEQSLRLWTAALPAGALLFPTEKGTTWRLGNYLKRVLKPLGASLNPPITDITHQAFRRTFATHFQRFGTVKDTQSQMRHSRPETTLRHYQKEIPESVREAVGRMHDAIKETVQ